MQTIYRFIHAVTLQLLLLLSWSPPFVSPTSFIALLLQCYLFDITACTKCINGCQCAPRPSLAVFDTRCREDNSRAVFTVIDHITQTLHYSNEWPRFRPFSTSVTELFTVFSPREWLFGIWTNVTWLQCLILQMIKNGTQERPRNWARAYFSAKEFLITSFKKGVVMGFFWGWF